jgi:AcrR family transcriptional regulator
MPRAKALPDSATDTPTPAKRARAPRKPAKRREQQRSIETRLTIIRAALAEFAEKGFEGASTRAIGERAEMQHPLITYHFRTKDVLWRAVAEHVWTTIANHWAENVPDDSSLSARERVKEEIRQLYRVQLEYPEFHHFMLRESRPGNPRLEWLADTFQKPLHDRIIGQIRAAQQVGDLPPSDPVLVNYLLVGMASAITSLGAEIKVLSGIDTTQPDVIEAYWSLIERVIFPTPFGR